MKKIVAFIITLVIFLSVFSTFGVIAFADEQGYITKDISLLNDTNTFNVKSDTNLFDVSTHMEESDVRSYVSATQGIEFHGFNLNSRNIGKEVYSGLPQITVLTHGMAGGAFTWSNNNVNQRFSYDPDSLVFKLKKKNPNSRLVWVKASEYIYESIYRGIKVDLIDIDTVLQCIEVGDAIPSTETIINTVGESISTKAQIIDNTPLILVYDASGIQGYQNGDYLYSAFTYAISSVVQQFASHNGGLLPKINLIGHSYGGIINLRYAASHPDMVHTVYSIGTPYFGSNITEIYHLFDRNSLVYRALRDDIINDSIQQAYLAEWNAKYNEFYKNKINFNVLGGYSTFSYLAAGLLESVNVESEEGRFLLAICGVLGTCAVGAVSGAAEIIEQVANRQGIQDLDYSEITIDCVSGILGIVSSIAWETETYTRSILGFKVNFYVPYNVFYDDGAVHLPSQLGVDDTYYSSDRGLTPSYQGFKTFYKRFNMFNSDLDKRGNLGDPKVIHNIEPRDNEFISIINNGIAMQNGIDYTVLYGDFEYRKFYEGSECKVAITKYVGNATSVNVPSNLLGFDVVRIDDYAFALHSVPLSDEGETVDSLQTVNLPSSITSIGKGAFKNRVSLANINFPNSISTIEENAFYNCISLGNITLPTGLNNIGACAFTGCYSLSFTEGTTNRYTVKENLIYEGNKIVFGTSYENIPNGITQIGEFAFTNNTEITTLCFSSSISVIGKGAFMGSSNLTTVIIPNETVYIGSNAFANCENLETVSVSGGSEVMGNAVFSGCPKLSEIEYNVASEEKDDKMMFLGSGNDESVSEIELTIGENVTCIPDGMFYGMTKIKELFIPMSINEIGDFSFAEMGSLTSLTFESGILEIGSYAFYDCGITSVTLPSSLQTVGVHAFNVERLYAYGDLPFTESMEDTYGVGFYSQTSGSYDGEDFYDWEDLEGWEIITDTDVETLSAGLAEYFGDTADAHIWYYSTETIGDALSDIETGKYVIYLTNEDDIASLPEQSEELIYMVITPSGVQILPENKGPVENILMGELIAMKSREVFGEEFWHSTAQALSAYPLFMLGEYANNYDIAMGVARDLNVDIIMFDSIEDNLDYFQMLDDTEFNTFIVISDSYVNLEEFGIENATGIQFFDEGPESMYNYGIFNLEYPVAYIVSDVLLWYEGIEPRPVLVPIENDCYYCVINISFDEIAITYTIVMMTWDEYWEEYDKYYVAKGIKEEVQQL